jgi:hypothetical protein
MVKGGFCKMVWIDIIKTFAAPVFGLIGVFVGSKLNMKRNVQIQKDFLSRKLRIEKYQEYSLDVSDFIREIASNLALIIKLIKSEITHSEFRNINDSNQDKATRINRRLLANKLFISNDYTQRVEKLNEQYGNICDKIYERYYEPNSKERYYDNNQITYETIKKDIEFSLTFGMEVYEDLSKELKKELEGLK